MYQSQFESRQVLKIEGLKIFIKKILFILLYIEETASMPPVYDRILYYTLLLFAYCVHAYRMEGYEVHISPGQKIS
jgi:hypothetical protein